jgi:hypothetical protein
MFTQFLILPVRNSLPYKFPSPLFPIHLTTTLNVLSLNTGPFRDLRSVAEAGRPREQAENHGRACTKVLFLQKAELGFFHFFRNSDRLAGTFRCWSEDPSTAWRVPSTAQDPAFAEYRFLQAYKGAENSKEKSRQCFTNSEMT